MSLTRPPGTHKRRRGTGAPLLFARLSVTLIPLVISGAGLSCAAVTFLYEPYDFTGLGVALGARFGVNLFAVHRHLEASFASSYEGDRFQVVTILLDHLTGQTDRARTVVSFLAVKYLDFHFVLPPVFRRLPLQYTRASVAAYLLSSLYATLYTAYGGQKI
jgi:hypothetical protein